MLLWLIILFHSANVAFAEPRALYDQGKFQEALDELQTNGMKTAADYYNAGNCLYRIGKTGQALSYFEKALALAPGQEDIVYNLELTRRSLESRSAVMRDPSFWTGRLLPFARTIPREWLDFAFAVTVAAFGIALLRARGIVSNQKRRVLRAFARPASIASLTALLLVGGVSAVAYSARGAQLAAVIADISVARSGPNETFTELFKLPAGTKVELMSGGRDGWRQIRFSLGNVGWIMEKELLPL